jgi:hypothetical protein
LSNLRDIPPQAFAAGFRRSSLMDCVLAAGEAQDRRIAREGGPVAPPRIPPANAHCGAFARMDPEAHRAASAKGGRACGAAKRREPFINNPMRHFGFTASEFARYGVMRIDTDLPQRTIAEIILQSRPTDPTGGG